MILTFAILVWIAERIEKKYRKNMYALIILFIVSTIFWGIYFEIFSSVSLFIDRGVDRVILGIHIPPSFFAFLQGFFVILLGAPLALLWKRLGHQKTSGISTKFGFALVAAGLSIAVLALGIHYTSYHHQVSWSWLLLFYLLLAGGELLLSPIGLAMVTELAPPKLVGFLMGVWFMTIGFGGWLSAKLADMAIIPQTLHNLHSIKMIYQHAFSEQSIAVLACGTLVLIASPWIKQLACTKNR